MDCEVCKDNHKFYVNAGVCTKRDYTEEKENCFKKFFNPIKDTCEYCKNGFYKKETLDADVFTCENIVIENCAVTSPVTKLGTETYGQCYICDEGYFLKPNVDWTTYSCALLSEYSEDEHYPAPNDYAGYISECTLPANTNQHTCAKIFKSGISSNLNRLYSCHVCVNKT